MAMNGIVLGDAIVAFIGGQNPLTPEQEAELKVIWEGIATQIITHIASNGIVATSGVDPQGGIVSSTGTIS